ncbi:MAG: hypothetical protein J6O09_00980 [Lachnospiraceae bacterium]|nr:hypothetical protein [Lachnospiraceae bacterium]
MNKASRLIKRYIALILVLLFSIESFAAVVGDNDGAAFITKAEFDSMKNDFQSQLDRYNSSLDNKIDGAIASYLSGVRIAKTMTVEPYDLYNGFSFVDYPKPTANSIGMWTQKQTWKKDGAFNVLPAGWRHTVVGPNYSSLGQTNTGCLGQLIHYAENRWRQVDVNTMQNNYELSAVQDLCQDAYYFNVSDRLDENKKNRLKSIGFGNNTLYETKWLDNSVFYVPHSARVDNDIYTAGTIEAHTGLTSSVKMTMYIGERFSKDPIYAFIELTQSSGRTAEGMKRYAGSQIGTFTIPYDFSNSSIGFLSNNPTDFDLCRNDEINGAEMIDATRTLNYTYLNNEPTGRTWAQIGYNSGIEPVHGDAIPVEVAYKKFNTSNSFVLKFSNAFSDSIYEKTNILVPFYGGCPLFKATGNGVAKLKIKGCSSTVADFLIKADPFTGWKKSDDQTNAVRITNTADNTDVTQTPTNGTTITIKFDVQNEKTYYFKCGINGAIEIVGDIELEIE